MDISTLGINKGKEKQFHTKGIYTIEHLINFLPRNYLDFRETTPIAKFKDGDVISVVGTVEEIKDTEKYFKAKIKDDSGKSMSIIWFNSSYVKKIIEKGKTYNFCGTGSINYDYYGARQMLNPMYFSEDLEKYKRIIPVYSKIKGMSDDYLLRSVNTGLALIDKAEYLEPEITDKYNLYSRRDTIKGIHQPDTMDDIKMSKQRILFDDLFYFSSTLLLRDSSHTNRTSIVMDKAKTIKPFIKTLPYTLTDDQLNTVREIYKDMKDGEKVSALVQGDVGSGKTITAFLLMLIAAENNYQSALMCPTTVLARQHYEELKVIGDNLGYEVAFLNGNVKAKEKKRILSGLLDGSIKMVVGTHAIISKGVEFDSLGLTVVDEEHRFGVVQREMVNSRTKEGVHSVTMSATPIPRSLAMTIYGDYTKVYNITQMPMGRKPVQTNLTDEEAEAYDFLKREVKKGRQGYVVCPLIEESDADVMKGVLSVEEVYKNIRYYYKNDNIKVAMIAGKMKQADIKAEIDKFSRGETDVLISTTIIEVGVNIPNSTVMVIQNAERFGLSQLHQLRGRVGRGNYQSYCIMVSNDVENEKLVAMTNTTNGFKIAEVDLKIRGAGDFIGTKQSGFNKYVMLMLAYPKLFKEIREEVRDILSDRMRSGWYENYFENIINEIELEEAS